VNPLAAKEYGDLKERHDFLYDQMADVESSRQELRKDQAMRFGSAVTS
jgi:chromosome segregation ATPase